MGVAADDLARHAPTERPVVLRVNAGRQSRQLAVGNAEGLGDLALGAECVHPLEGQHHGVFCLVASGFPQIYAPQAPHALVSNSVRSAIQCAIRDTFRRHSYFSAQATLFGTTPLEHYSRPDRSTQNLLGHPLPRPIRTTPEAQQTPRIPCFT